MWISDEETNKMRDVQEEVEEWEKTIKTCRWIMVYELVAGFFND